MNNISPNQLDGARIEIYDSKSRRHLQASCMLMVGAATPVDAWVKAGVVINGMALGVAAVAIYVVRPR